MKHITLDLGGADHINLTLDGRGGGTVESSLRWGCAGDDEKEYNAAVNTIESIVLAHACAGVNVEDEKYVNGICTALEAIAAKY